MHKERRLSKGDIATLQEGEALVIIGSQWQKVWVGGPLIPEWLKVLHGRASAAHHPAPENLRRTHTLPLPPIGQLADWDGTKVATTPPPPPPGTKRAPVRPAPPGAFVVGFDGTTVKAREDDDTIYRSIGGGAA